MQPFGTTDTVIPVGGFLVVEFCGSASYLSDAGDTVQLYNAASAQVDAHAYPATTNGKSHARIPDGAAWVDPVPTPGNKNTATRADLEAEGWSEDLINDTLAKLVIDTSSSSKTVSTVSNTPVSVSAHSVGVSQLGTSTSSVAADISSNTAVRDATASSDGTQITSTSSETLSPGTASITQATTTIESAPTTASSSVTATQTPGGNGNTDTVSMSPATTTKPTVPDDMTAQTKSNLSDNPPVDIEEDERSGASKKTDAISAETNTSDNEQKPTVVDQTTDGEGDSKEKVTPVTESVNDQANETTN